VFRQRSRKLPPLNPEQQEERALLMKEWARYKHAERLRDLQLVDKVMNSQQKALDELRAESEELYQEAIQVSSLSRNNLLSQNSM
jgi:large subunit ribosomal protein L40